MLIKQLSRRMKSRITYPEGNMGRKSAASKRPATRFELAPTGSDFVKPASTQYQTDNRIMSTMYQNKVKIPIPTFPIESVSFFSPQQNFQPSSDRSTLRSGHSSHPTGQRTHQGLCSH